jgi:predicted transcriptional regulator
MNVITLKTDLHRLIDSINDVSILNTVKIILSKRTIPADWWDQLSDAERESIEIGLAQANNDELIPHEEVMREVREKYNLNR